jgi:hypothetical protein
MPLPSDFGILLLVSFLVSFANEISHGRYLGWALLCLSLALLVLTWRFLGGMRDRSVATAKRRSLHLWLIWCALTSMPITALLDPKILAHPHMSLGLLRALEVVSIALVFTYLPFLNKRSDSQIVRNVRFAAFGAVVVAAGIAIIHISPAPTIDVWDLQMHGAKALLRGENPYVTVAVPDTTPANHPFPYVPYLYAPGTLYAGAIGLLVGGDVRYAMLIALIVTGAALRVISLQPSGAVGSGLPSLVEDAPALFVWLMPPLAFIIELSWIDPVQLLLICLAGAAAMRGRMAVSAAVIGLAVVSKQTMFWLIPLAGFALGYRRREWLIVLATVALGLAPFAIGDFHALKHNTVDLLLALSPRDDALCVAVWYKSTFGAPFPTALSTVTAAAVVGMTLLRARVIDPFDPKALAQRAALFGCAVALTYFTFFFFAKWAFANYYFLVAGLAALAAATLLREWYETAASPTRGAGGATPLHTRAAS